MKGITFLLTLTTGLLASGMLVPAILLCSGCANAQVTSDGTTNTTVNPNGNNFTILNGNEKGSNLFHSFRELSVPTGGSATFNLINTPNITTIFSRVTGGSISNIDGLIRTINSSNPVNLFLINPAGIVFGKNASLNIGGSFVGTTANSIKFADGVEFSATDMTTTPLLTISAPIGLQMGENLARIQVQGIGHNLTAQDPYFRPYFPTGLTTGLQVKPGKTLALVGGDVSLNGGLLTAPGGRIELGSVNPTGQVGVNSHNGRFALDYSNVPNLGNIQLSQKSLLNVSGTSTSSIQVQANRISLSDGSIIWSQNRGIQPGGDINIRATELLELNGTTPDERLRSGIVSETLGIGTSSNIAISTGGFILQNGAAIHSRTYTPAPSGNVTVNATDFIQMRGVSPKIGLNNSLGTTTLFITQQQKPVSTAKAGDVSISTPHLSMADGSYISSLSLSDSPGGNININTDTTEIIGGTLGYYYNLATTISGVGYSRGNSGNVTLNTHTLTLQDGGTITTTNLGRGNAGNVTINATESVEIKGLMPATKNEFFVSNISSTVGSPGISLQQLASYQALGNSGNVNIRTPVLKISNRAGVSVGNYGTVGTAGTLTIDADSIQLNQGSIGASAASGEGGNINLNLQKLLLLRNQSKITAEAGGTGNGGNITINSPVIVGFENGDIIANAIAGRGGNIEITTQGIFGLKYRDRLTPENDITASSEFGVNGTVDINNFGVDPSSGLVELPVNLVDSSQQIATGCSSTNGSSFVATGRGGVPQNPNQDVRSDRTWSDIRDISAYQKNSEVIAQIPPSPETLVQATSWRRNAQGKIELLADKSPAQMQQVLTCAAVPKN
jgi:filamentous hemagglutinin family protein